VSFPHIFLDCVVQTGNIRLIAIDFDNTIVDTHTGGSWEGSAQELVPHVRPEFKAFIHACNLLDSVTVVVATFSSQVELIEEVLKMALSSESVSPARSTPNIKVFGGTESLRDPETPGKLSHLSLAISHYNSHKLRDGAAATVSSTLLIDDDAHNTKIALSKGYWAITFNPSYPSSMFHDSSLLRPSTMYINK
jgi:hypothetical protein